MFLSLRLGATRSVPVVRHSHRRTMAMMSAPWLSLRTHSTTAESNDGETSVSNSSQAAFRTLELHCMPRTWLHEEVVQFLHQVAEHAGIEPPPKASSTGGVNADKNENDQNEEAVEAEENESSVPFVTSPFLAGLRIPFGRRTGIVFGAPVIKITSSALADYLLHNLSFDPDDYRSRIYFTELTNSKETSAVSHEEPLETEQQRALDSLELDRYLLAPDLLYDMAKMRQRRLVTRSSRLILHTFADEESEKNKEQSMEEQMLAGDCKDLGRGSMQNISLPLPYVQGRRGTAWAKSYFKAVEPDTPEAAHQCTAKDNEQATRNTKASQKNISPISWRCQRCNSVLTVPIDPHTQRPSFVILAEHLEGTAPVTNTKPCTAGTITFASSLLSSLPDPTPDSTDAALDSLRQILFGTAASSSSSSSAVRVIVAIENPKTPANMGGILRAVGCLGAAGVVFTGTRLLAALPHRPATDTRASGRDVPHVAIASMKDLFTVLRRDGPAHGVECVFIAVDLIAGAEPLPLFSHPFLHDTGKKIVVYLFGPEDGSIGAETVAMCDAAVFLPTRGSLNLAATVNVLLYDRCAATWRQRAAEGNPALSNIEAEAMASRNPNNRTTWEAKAGEKRVR